MNSKQQRVFSALCSIAEDHGFTVKVTDSDAAYARALLSEIGPFDPDVDWYSARDLANRTAGVTCKTAHVIILGPAGRNVGVLAHELCHALNEPTAVRSLKRKQFGEGRANMVGYLISRIYGSDPIIQESNLMAGRRDVDFYRGMDAGEDAALEIMRLLRMKLGGTEEEVAA